MASLQKFKFLARQCAVVGSPTRSPTTSPVVHIRRRKTLRMLLGRGGNGGGALHRRFHNHHRREDSPDRQGVADKKKPEIGREHLGVRLKLKDLFISSPPPPSIREEEETQRLFRGGGSSGGGGGRGGLAVSRRVGAGGGSLRPLSATFRQRLLMRRAWRPVLVAIPEQSP